MNHLRISIAANGPHISDSDRIRDYLTQHLEIEGLEYVPDETYSTGPESSEIEVHLMAFKSADTLVFVRVGSYIQSGNVVYIETSKNC